MMAKVIEPVYRLLGAKIEQMRTILGWTQKELADKVGLTRCSITNIESGRQRLLLADVETFARAFNTLPKNMMRGIWN
jgi:transcriptional regulator with XRE-family HTH domain